MTDNSELEAAIEKLISVIRDEFDTYEIKNDQLPMFTDVRTALTTYRDRFHALEAENARLRAALLPFAQTWAAYQRDYNSDRDKAAFYATINNEANWFSIWMHHDGYKSVKEADYQQAATMTEEATE